MAFGIWLSQTTHPTTRYDVASTVSGVAHRLAAVVDAGDEQRAAKVAMQAGAQLPPDVLAALRGHRVQVDPYQTALVWAYDLRWGPSEVWALYSSYTAWLDDANAASISRPSGPERILVNTRAPAVGGRDPDFESPAYQLAKLCRWRVVAAGGRWRVLASGPDRCGTAEPLGTVRFADGEQIAVPAARHAGSIVTVRLRWDTGLSDRLAALLFKPFEEQHVSLDGHRYSLVVRTAGQPLVVTGTTRIAVDHAGEAVFEEIPTQTP
jgi:hypothetical protein